MGQEEELGDEMIERQITKQMEVTKTHGGGHGEKRIKWLGGRNLSGRKITKT